MDDSQLDVFLLALDGVNDDLGALEGFLEPGVPVQIRAAVARAHGADDTRPHHPRQPTDDAMQGTGWERKTTYNPSGSRSAWNPAIAIFKAVLLLRYIEYRFPGNGEPGFVASCRLDSELETKTILFPPGAVEDLRSGRKVVVATAAPKRFAL